MNRNNLWLWFLLASAISSCLTLGKEDHNSSEKKIFTEEEINNKVQNILSQIKEPSIPSDTLNPQPHQCFFLPLYLGRC